jgi:hypothetical protein
MQKIPPSAKQRLTATSGDMTRQGVLGLRHRVQKADGDTLSDSLCESLTRPEARGLHPLGVLTRTHVDPIRKRITSDHITKDTRLTPAGNPLHESSDFSRGSGARPIGFACANPAEDDLTWRAPCSREWGPNAVEPPCGSPSRVQARELRIGLSTTGTPKPSPQRPKQELASLCQVARPTRIGTASASPPVEEAQRPGGTLDTWRPPDPRQNHGGWEA